MAGERWLFSKSQLSDTPSRRCGIDADKELSNRQQAANFIQDMGQRLQVTQLCINTAIVYMHRFYMFHSFNVPRFHRNKMAAVCLFLAAKVEEQPRKLEHVIKVSHICLHKSQGLDPPPLDTKHDAYLEMAQELVQNENILLQSLGFEIQIDHPHTHVVKTCQMVRASKDLAQTSYFLATNSLHLTTLCLQGKPTVVACVCIHLACKWSNWELPRSNEGKEWYSYVDKNITLELLEQHTQDFLSNLEKCPSKLKRKIMTWKKEEEIKKTKSEPTTSGAASSSHSSPKPSTSKDRMHDKSVSPVSPLKTEQRPSDSLKHDAKKSKSSYFEYKERKERELKQHKQEHHPEGINAKPELHHGKALHSDHKDGKVHPGKHVQHHSSRSDKPDSIRSDIKQEHRSRPDLGQTSRHAGKPVMPHDHLRHSGIHKSSSTPELRHLHHNDHSAVAVRAHVDQQKMLEMSVHNTKHFEKIKQHGGNENGRTVAPGKDGLPATHVSRTSDEHRGRKRTHSHKHDATRHAPSKVAKTEATGSSLLNMPMPPGEVNPLMKSSKKKNGSRKTPSPYASHTPTLTSHKGSVPGTPVTPSKDQLQILSETINSLSQLIQVKSGHLMQQTHDVIAPPLPGSEPAPPLPPMPPLPSDEEVNPPLPDDGMYLTPPPPPPL